MRLLEKTRKQENKKIIPIIVIAIFVFLFSCFLVNSSYATEPIVPGAPGTIVDEENTGITERYAEGNYDLNDFIQIAIQASKFILGDRKSVV